MRVDRRGMTLVELLLALGLTGLALMVATSLSGGVIDQVVRLGQRTEAHDRAVGGARLFTQLLEQMATPVGEPLRFEGERDRLRFPGVCPTASGSSRACTVTVRLTPLDESRARLSAAWDGMPGVDLGTLGGGARFTFASRDGTTDRWYARWGSSLRAPRAIGLVLAADTLVFAVGAP